jgi:hypothetical protein
MWLMGTRDEKLLVWNGTGWRGYGLLSSGFGGLIAISGAIILCIMVYGFKETTAEGLEACVLWIYHVVWGTIPMKLIDGKPRCWQRLVQRFSSGICACTSMYCDLSPHSISPSASLSSSSFLSKDTPPSTPSPATSSPRATSSS